MKQAILFALGALLAVCALASTSCTPTPTKHKRNGHAQPTPYLNKTERKTTAPTTEAPTMPPSTETPMTEAPAAIAQTTLVPLAGAPMMASATEA